MSKKKSDKETPLKINTTFDKALKILIDSPQEQDRKLKNRDALVTYLHDNFICLQHNQRIFNCRVHKRGNYEIDYETCCKYFSDIIFQEITDHPLQ